MALGPIKDDRLRQEAWRIAEKLPLYNGGAMARQWALRSN